MTNAVIDALRPLGVTYIDMPLTPMRIWQAIHTPEAGGDRAGQGRRGARAGLLRLRTASPTEGGAQ